MLDKKMVRIIVGVLILMYVIFGTSFLTNLKETKASVSETNKKTTTKVEVDGNLKVTYLDVGQADAILIENKEEYMLIDAGNNEDGDKLVKYIKEEGISKFKYVVGTHAHEDHIGGMDNIIKNFDIDTFYMPNVLATSKTFEDVLNALEEKQLKFSVPKEGDSFKLEDANVEVLYVGEESSDLNDSSIVLKVTFGNTSFLFTGDATSRVEKKLLDKNIESNVLKVGHHGSSYSSTNEFLDKVNPSYAVISCGKDNIYNHPEKVTLDKLNNRNIKIFRTDLDGTIIITSDGDSINVSTKTTDTNG